MKKAVLAYSGGLDTSYCLVRYAQDENYEVHTVIVNSGGFTKEEVERIEKRAYELGSKKHVTIDITEKYYQDCIRFMIYGNVLKNNTYPLSVSAERMFQSIAIANYARQENAECIIHGSTGAGNDQIRFDVAFSVISPNSEIITPIRDEKLSRQAEIDYLVSKGVEYSWEKAKYSINVGIWGTSVGGVETLTSNQSLPESAFPTQLTKTEADSQIIEIEFEKGQPISLDGKKMPAVELIQTLNSLAGAFAIGRDTHVGDTILGIKGRVGFEAPAPYVLIKAHHLLEKHTLSRWQQLHKESVATWYGTLLHEAQYLDPVMRDFEALLESSQERVSGKVRVALRPYRMELLGIESPYDYMQSKVATYGEENEAWDSRDARGFIKIFGNQLKIHHSFDKK
ncbi:MAG: argininosuccinate synthase [Flavobacteriaceae bacterium]|nr:MAG: argininosuccinate synthase [Flavobacteriaceae bacterium]